MDEKELEQVGAEALRLGNEELVPAVNEEYSNEWSKIQKSAQALLFEIQNDKMSLEKFEELLLDMAAKRADLGKGYADNQKYIDKKNIMSQFLAGEIDQIPQKIFSAMFQFQKDIAQILDVKLQIVFMYDNGQGPDVFELHSIDILKYDYSSDYKLVGRYVKDIPNQLGKSLSEIHNEFQDWKFSLQGLRETRAEILERYSYSRSKKKVHYIFYKPNRRWIKYKISSQGSVEEAYAGFILKNEASPSFTSPMEQNIHDYIIKGLNLVTNLTGLLHGDVSANGIEYHVKSFKASTASLQQFINLANKIVNNEIIDRVSLEEEIKKKETIEGQLNKKIARVAADPIEQDILKWTKNKININLKF